MKTKHPTLGKKKLTRMYFLRPLKSEIDPDSPTPLEKIGYHKFKNTKWTFFGLSKTENRYTNVKGKKRIAYLLNPGSSTPIVTATKYILPLRLRTTHAFHPRVQELIDFKLRLALMASPKTPTLKEKLFKAQKGMCGLCNRPIEFECLHFNTVDIHHINPIKKGGDKLKLSNLTITHS
jgi:HNH endonuclease